MSKFYGKIGFANNVETEPGIWVDDIVEYDYYGDLLKNNRRLQSGDRINDNITISNEISILSDPYITEHFFDIRYVKFYTPKIGGVWTVSNVEVSYPRLILTIGGVYNGEQANIAN